jgi:hypothetical protein
MARSVRTENKCVTSIAAIDQGFGAFMTEPPPLS